MNKTLIFLHIHKTAGTSLKHLIMRQYPRDTTYLMDQHYFRLQKALDELGTLDLEARRRIDCLIGHVAYGVHSILPRESTYLTMLREPVSRTLSHYHFVRAGSTPDEAAMLDEKEHLTLMDHLTLYERLCREHLRPENLPTNSLQAALDKLTLNQRQFREHLRPENTPANSLEAFLDMSLASESLNLQTRMIAGFVPHDRLIPPYPPLPDNALETAKINLRDNISVCGLVERFDESILLMKSIFGWHDIYYMRENVRRGQSHEPSVAKAMLRRIERHCELDLELYGYAQALFAERLRELPDLTAAALRRFRLRHGLYRLCQGVRRAYDRTRLPRVKSYVGRIFRR